MEETKLTYDQVVERYGFKKKDVDKIMKRTKPKTEVDGIRILMKEGERRLKLKKSYADRMAKKNGVVLPTAEECTAFIEQGIKDSRRITSVGSGMSEPELNNNVGEGMLDEVIPDEVDMKQKMEETIAPRGLENGSEFANEIDMSPEQEQEAKDFDECTKKASVKMNEIIAKNHLARRRFFLGYHPITGKAQYR